MTSLTGCNKPQGECLHSGNQSSKSGPKPPRWLLNFSLHTTALEPQVLLLKWICLPEGKRLWTTQFLFPGALPILGLLMTCSVTLLTGGYLTSLGSSLSSMKHGQPEEFTHIEPVGKRLACREHCCCCLGNVSTDWERGAPGSRGYGGDIGKVTTGSFQRVPLG